jgi:hypothetical protein
MVLINRKMSVINGNKGQLAVFVILAIAIVAVVGILFIPNLGTLFVESTPELEVTECIEDSVLEGLELAMAHGGSLEPELYYTYNGENREYLCYTRDYYSTCIMQKPLLKQSIEAEIEGYIAPVTAACVKDMKDKLRAGGYTIEAKGTEEANIQIKPDFITIEVDLDLKASKDGGDEVYSNFASDVPSESYDLVMLASTISNWEAIYGDSSTESFMAYYPNIRVAKYKQSDGTTIYEIKDRESEEELVFASRSGAWSPGYAF